MKVIGITGGVGSGKTCILTYLRQLAVNYPKPPFNQIKTYVIEADKTAHDLQKPGNLCYDAIVAAFGQEILHPDGTIDRKQLGEIVFADEQRLKELNAIVHPFVKKHIIQTIETIRTEQTADFIFIEAALLIEEHYDEICDSLWYVYVSEENRRSRLKASRGYSDYKISQVMENQLSEESFRRACQTVIDNNNSQEDTYRQIREVLACQIS